jgi:hypothetical protein
MKRKETTERCHRFLDSVSIIYIFFALWRKVHRYSKYQCTSVCPLVGTGTPQSHPPLPQTSVRGWGSPNSGDWR